MQDTFGLAQGGRREDLRFLKGEGRYVADLVPAGALFAAFLRAPQAHARITGLDLTAARAVPGVRLVWALPDLEAAGVNPAMRGYRVNGPDGSPGAGPERPVLARDIVRFAGELIACVVAATPAAARDGVEAILADLDDLPVKTDLAPGGPALHPEAPDNIGYRFALGDAPAVEAAFARAARTVSLQIADHRVAAASMEPRGAFAEWDGTRLHLCVNGQGVWGQKAQLATQLNLPPEAIRVTNPDVGGGFGMKAMNYPEYIVIAAAARALGAPVFWMSDRSEAMLSDNAGRDLISQAELAFDADHRILAYRVHNLSALGAYNSQFGQGVQSEMFARVLTGVYDIPAALLTVEGIYSNTCQTDAYRGAGRPEAIYVLETLMDHAARALDICRFDLRRRNFIRHFPHKTPMGELYDVGDFHAALTRLELSADTAGFEDRRRTEAGRGLLRGMGVASYIEAIMGAPSEASQIAFLPGGKVTLRVGTQSNGQGHETVFAEFLARETGIPAEDITVIQGDSDLIAVGGGTGGSRSVTVQTHATRANIAQMTAAFAAFLTPEFGAVPEFAEGRFSLPGQNRSFTLQEAAALAQDQGREDLTSHRAEATLPARSFPNGAHLCEVVIDPETGATSVDRYHIIDDFGTLLAPALVLGQVHGGVVQGLGQVLSEALVYDDQGQLLTGSFMDYAMPRAADVPMIEVDFAPVPSTANSLGMKGCGEAGTVGAMAAVANAVRDALASQGIGYADMPFPPVKLWSLLQQRA
ncbi:xanthine dehydrogenase family protein molybdopterin-binding subunit [Falsigemmobacter faecalis]|uniref:Xanthine dehydrogenase family protein molybdopterin-binding subunit n=1 Tax=Falsigemmobacter faecalis TaxID=2488730 RepID=A0A3P3DMX3_9RHOB|nr:xanthine dehydrogenase family protein molybdopterin-binding subunit [Falsigemmobacter faecalis]RRH75521.1 xanthine dehydrogenase family protein molybdopterin-binding subunit [Falsigemmobacter faecalis]